MIEIQEPLKAAILSLKANKMRSALTTLGIVIGVAAVIVVVSLVQGLKGSVMAQIERAGSNSLVVRPAMPNDMPFDEFLKLRDRDLTLENMHALAQSEPRIQSVTPVFFSSGEVKHAGRSTTTQVSMTDETWLEQNKINLAAGRNFVAADLRLRTKVAIIGPRLIEKLGIKGNPIGQYLSTNTLSLEIIGLLESQGASIGNDQDNTVVIPITTGLATVTDAQRRQLIFLARYEATMAAEDAEDMVRDALRRIKGVRPKEKEGFRVLSMKQVASIMDTVTSAITAVAGGMVSVALLVGGIGIMNIMLVSVTERTREIGIRKAVGARRRDVLTQFLFEAAFLSILGGVLGILLGFGVGAIVGKALVGTVGTIPLWAILAGFGVPAAIGLIFGMYPAAKASRLDPIESLRYE